MSITISMIRMIRSFTSQQILDSTGSTTTIFTWQKRPAIINFHLEIYEAYLKRIIIFGSLEKRVSMCSMRKTGRAEHTRLKMDWLQTSSVYPPLSLDLIKNV